jgi:hypothetical protein
MQTAFLTAQLPMLKTVDLRQLALGYVHDAIGKTFTVAKLRLQPEQARWWALIQYQADGQCRPLGVGRVEIDAQSGRIIPLQDEEIQTIREKATILAAQQQQTIPRNANGYIPGEFARKQANRYLWDHLGMYYGATAPLFTAGVSDRWQVTIIFKMYELGPFAVGTMAVEAQMGEIVPLTKTEIQQIKERVYAIVGPQAPSADAE